MIYDLELGIWYLGLGIWNLEFGTKSVQNMTTIIKVL